jgi:hypothetical protein
MRKKLIINSTNKCKLQQLISLMYTYNQLKTNKNEFGNTISKYIKNNTKTQVVKPSETTKQKNKKQSLFCTMKVLQFSFWFWFS